MDSMMEGIATPHKAICTTILLTTDAAPHSSAVAITYITSKAPKQTTKMQTQLKARTVSLGARTAPRPVFMGRSRAGLRVQNVAAPMETVPATPIDKFARNPVRAVRVQEVMEQALLGRITA